MTGARFAAAVTAVMALGVAPAAAQFSANAKPAFSVERFTPAPGGLTMLGVEEADVLPNGRWAFALSTWRADRPIVLRDLDSGELVSAPVRARYGQELGAAYGFGTRYQVGLAVPFAAQWGARLQGIGLSDKELQHLVAGDVRIHGRIRLVGRGGDQGFAVALSAALILPTGDDGDFAGDESWGATWNLRLGWRGDWLELNGGAGLRLRAEEVVLLSPARPHGNELLASAGAAVRLSSLGESLGGPGQLWAIGEIEAAYGDDAGRGASGPSPGELRFGARAQIAHCWSAAVAAGGGFTPDEIGSPRWRVLAQLAFHQSPVHDLDGDGVVDKRDACWREREDRDGYQDWDGCPEADNDGDGLLDREDMCPQDREDVDGYRDSDGCPDDETRTEPKVPTTIVTPDFGEPVAPPAPVTSAPVPPAPVTSAPVTPAPVTPDD